MAFDVSGALGAGYTPKEIIDHLSTNPHDLPNYDIAGALKAGYSPAEIVDHLNPKADKINVQGIPVLAPIDRGLAHLRAEGANLATDLGFRETGAAIRQSIPQATLSAATSASKVSESLSRRDYLGALANVPSAALEGTIPIVGGLVAGAASGGSVPAMLAAGAGIGAVSQGDQIARDRARNNGRTDPTAGDLAAGIAGGAMTGGVGSLGLRGMGGGLAQAARSTALHGAADAAQPEIAALAGSVGTNEGAQNASGQDMAGAALTGLATRGALAAPAAARAAVEMTPGGRRAALADQFAAMSPEEQTHVTNTAAAGKLIEDAQAGAVPMPSGRPTDPTIARTVGDLLDRRIGSLVDHLDGEGLLGGSGWDAVQTAWRAAADPRMALLKGHLDGLDGLGLSEGMTQTLKDAIQQRNMVAGGSVDPEPPGMIGAAGAVASRLAGHALHSLIPGPLATAAGWAIRPMGGALAAKFGLYTPELASAASRASDMMAAAGRPIPDTLGGLIAAMSAGHDVVQAQARMMNLPDPSASVPGGEAAAVQGLKPDPTAPQAIATARAAASQGVSGAASLTSAMPNLDGLSASARAQGQLLPEWQYGLGKDLSDALHLSGTPKAINTAQEVAAAVRSMQSRGWFDQPFADSLMRHDGRVVRGLYNVIRNEMLGRHGVDRRTLEAQSDPH